MFNFLRPLLISIASLSLVLTACGGEEASTAGDTAAGDSGGDVVFSGAFWSSASQTRSRHSNREPPTS